MDGKKKCLLKETTVLQDVMDNVLLNVTNTISPDVKSTVSVNSDSKKIRHRMDYFIFTHNFNSDCITIYNYYYSLSLHKLQFKTKKYWHTSNITVERSNDYKNF